MIFSGPKKPRILSNFPPKYQGLMGALDWNFYPEKLYELKFQPAPAPRDLPHLAKIP
jgi:hypothetical protein